MKHPIQPLAIDAHGIIRFKGNAIVRHLLDHGGIDMNAIARLEFPQEDREQFAMLIGYSLGGFDELNYVSDATSAAAHAMHAEGLTEDKARIKSLEDMLETVREGLKIAAPAVFAIHPDNLSAERQY